LIDEGFSGAQYSSRIASMFPDCTRTSTFT
jgi:hypothetical protein